jgi:tetratricopeptide (TPR) repeat protein
MSSSSWKAFAFSLVLILLFVAPLVMGQQAATPAMSVCKARRTIVTELKQDVNTCHGSGPYLQSLPSGVAFRVGELEFQAEPCMYRKLFPPGIFRVELKTLAEVTSDGSRLLVDGKDPLWGRCKFCTESDIKKNLSDSSILGYISFRSNPDPKALRGDWAFENAQAFATAMNTLRLYARTFDPSHDGAPACFADNEEHTRIWVEFQRRAAAWRALPVKPSISDDVKQHRLLAEDSYQQKQFETAAAEYEAGLEIDPLWAQGHFNAAVIYGELKDYDDAIWHMRCYLELMPDAPDSQQSRDQMLLRQGKAKQQAAAQ